MAGIYIHIPICATRCIYCDFYSTTLRGRGDALVTALGQEMDERQGYLHEPVKTIYLGGGTPSQLGSRNVAAILRCLSSHFDLSQCHEVTMEANPEDIANGSWEMGTSGLLPEDSGAITINRISMGVQSMVDGELSTLHRRHDSERVRKAVSMLRAAGIRNLSLDLMYGLPQQTLESWEYSIDQVIGLGPEHISAYNLMVEEGTPLYDQVEQGKLHPCDDETCLRMAQLLRQKLRDAGYGQYEISNYARPGFHSRHNASYWTQTPYLGLGPGAHSYDGARTRQWNAPDLKAYLAGERKVEAETLSDHDLYNERVMLGLRTARGTELAEVLARSKKLSAPNGVQHIVEDLIRRGLLQIKKQQPTSGREMGEDMLCLTEKGLALGDEVIRELMIIE